MNKLGRALQDRRVMLATLCSCVSLFLVANSSTLFAQGDGSATMRAIKPFIGFEETFQWSAAPEVIRKLADKETAANEAADEKGDSAYAWASELFFTKEIWQLSFKYKNVRTIDVDFPTKDGSFVTKRVWYLVYSATNTGERLRATLDDSVESDVTQQVVNANGDVEVFDHPSNNLFGVYKSDKFNSDEPVKFAPRFVLASASIADKASYVKDEKSGLFFGQKKGAAAGVYYDSFLPLATAKIMEREAREGQKIVDSVRMANRPIKPGETVWGVATWVDVDPRIDRFSIYVSGLTNALRWEISEDEDVEEARVGEGRDVMRKVLKLNFVNPSDEAHSGEEIYNYLPGELDYQWIYM